MSIETKFVERLKKAMDYKNINARELSQITNICESTISRYLSGKVSPKMDYMSKIAKALEINVMWLAGFDVPMLNGNSTKERIINSLESMNEKDLDDIETFIKTFIKRAK